MLAQGRVGEVMDLSAFRFACLGPFPATVGVVADQLLLR